MNNVKAISLDDLDDLSNPLGGVSQPDTLSQGVSLASPYAGQSPHYEMGDRDDETVKHGGGFQLSEGLTRFSSVLGIRKGEGSAKVSPLALALILGMLGLGGAYIVLGEGFFTQLTDEIMAGEDGFTVDATPGKLAQPVAKKPVIESIPNAEVPPSEEVQVVDEIPGNPYWKLPNPAPVMADVLPAITPQQTDSWRAGLNHPFPYQRLKTTQEMRKNRVEGSVVILYEALAQPKFWTRMEALQGIADQGVAIDNESMKTAIGDTRSDLVKNYFKRFRLGYNETSAHIMRQALRIVDGQARFVILSNLVKYRNEVNDQYLYAAVQTETDIKVKEMVTAALAVHPVPAAHIALHDRSMAGDGTVRTLPPKKKVEAVKVDKAPAEMKTGEVYFINESESEPTVPIAPIEATSVDDGFDDLQRTDEPVEVKPGA